MDAPVSRTEEPSLAPEIPPPPGEPEPSAPADTAPAPEPVLPPAPALPEAPKPRTSRRKATQLAATEEAPLASLAPEMHTKALEDRVRRLEDALAQMQHLQGRPTPPAAQIQRQPTTPVPTGPSAPDLLLDVGKRLFNNTTTASPAAPAASPPTPASTPASSPTRHLWLLLDTIAELRAIFRMFVDPRYHLSWSARVVPLVLLAAILTSYYWVPLASIAVVGYWINKAVDLILAFFLFKVLGHESRRYRQTSPDLPAHLRL